MRRFLIVLLSSSAIAHALSAAKEASFVFTLARYLDATECIGDIAK